MIDWAWLVPIGIACFGAGMAFGLFLATFAARDEPR